MIKIKAPRSLRIPLEASGLLTAFYLVTPAAGQTADATRLPALTVDAPATTPKPRRSAPVQPAPKPLASPTPADLPTEQPVSATPQPQAVTTPPTTSGAANANSRANPAAPFQVQRAESIKLPEPVANTARTISIVPKEVLEEKGATSLRDLVRTTPGLTLGSGEGGNAFGDRVLIRGFDARNDMYIDGIRQSGVTTREAFNAEQVEIIAGPSSSIFGRGTAGGAVNIVTKKPLPTSFANTDLTLGTDATKRLTFDLNEALSDTFAIRANIMAQDAKVAGRDGVFDKRYGGSIATEWKPRDTLKIGFDYVFVYFDQMPDWGIPFDPRTRRPFTESGLRRGNFYGIPNRDFQRNYQHLATGSVEWQIDPDIVLSSRLRYGYTVTDYIASKTGTPVLTNPNSSLWTVPSTPTSRYQVSKTLANQTDATVRFQSLGAKHTLVAGIELSREEISQDTYNGLNIECFPNCSSTAGTGINLSLFSPSVGGILSNGTPARAGRSTYTNVNTASIYLLDTLNWSEKLFLTVGGRLDSYAIERLPFGSTRLARNDLLANWNAGLLYKLLPNTGVYFAYGTSSNPVGAELDGSSDDYGGLTAANSVFAPERNSSVETGLKMELMDKRLLLTASAFQTTKENARESIGTGTSATLRDSAAYRIRGLDFGVAGNVTDRWSVFGGAVFLNSQVTASAVAGNAGRPLANIAHQSFNLLTKYQVTDGLTVGAQATYKGEILGGTLAATSYAAGTVNVGGTSVATPAGYNKLPGGWRFDLMASQRITESVTVRFQIINVMDTILYDAFYRSTTPFVYLAGGRTAYVTVQTRF